MNRTIRSFINTALALISILALGGLPAFPAHGQTSDPRYLIGTYLGGPRSDYGRAVAIDAQGYIYIAGDLFSSTFSGFDIPKYGGRDVLVLKLSPDGKEILAGASAGSTSDDEALDMIVTPAGEPILTIRPGAKWPTSNALHPEPTRGNEGVLIKFNAALEEVFSTYTLIDMSNQGGQNIALDAQGNIYVTGDRYVASTVARDLIIQKYSPNGQQLLFERIWDGDRSSEYGYAINVQPDGSAYITGVISGDGNDFAITPDAQQKSCGRKLALGDDRACDDDAFVVMLNPDGTTRYASYLGGNGGDKGVDIAVDGQGGVVIAGTTFSADFPITNGALLPACKASSPENGCYYDTFVTRLGADGQIIYSTYLNSNDAESMDFISRVAVDASGNATIVGRTSGQLFPVQNPIQSSLVATPCLLSSFTRFCYDTFITTLSPTGLLIFSTYLGGENDEAPEDVALGTDGSVYVVGSTESRSYPVAPGARQASISGGSDFFLARVKLNNLPDTIIRPFSVGLPLIQR
ncbi:MAG: SBBP repeat-containing protein [Roseiflexaceae bacterium]|nr:SBBP repeat-containing protein [Roseiflexaceae bacterium]